MVSSLLPANATVFLLKSLILVLACCGMREGNMHVLFSSLLTVSVPCQMSPPHRISSAFDAGMIMQHQQVHIRWEIHVRYQDIYESLSNYNAKGTKRYRGLEMAVQKVVKLCIESCHVSSSGYGVCRSSRRSCHLVLVRFRFCVEILN